MEFKKVLNEFGITGEPKAIGAGLINDTYLIGDTVLQKINSKIFPHPDLVMENFSKVSHHLEKKVKDPRRFLKLKATKSGSDYYLDNGSCWRAVNYIPQSESFIYPPSANHCFEAAKAFGSFQKNLLDLTGIVPTKRQKFDLAGRLKDFKGMNPTSEISFALENQMEISLDLPQRVIHHDTKISNILFDTKTQEGLCVIDLDTVCEGPVLWDFGDMVRSMAPTVGEEDDPEKVEINLEYYKAIVSGYLAGADFITKAERKSLFSGALMITYTLALRFLSDHLKGDIYFKVKYKGHNLTRAKNQIRLFEQLKKNQSKLEHIIVVG